MKIRNKKTGEVVESFKSGPIDLYFYPNEHKGGDDIERETYQSIAELNSEWEDYEPKEPLIKDEKIRKAVRAWAEANEREYLLVIKSGGRLEVSDGSPHLIYISFQVDNDTLKSLEDRTYYPIAELCGEEEE